MQLSFLLIQQDAESDLQWCYFTKRKIENHVISQMEEESLITMMNFLKENKELKQFEQS